MVWSFGKQRVTPGAADEMGPAARLIADTSGTAAIEFALCVPFFVVILMGVVELGFSTFQSMQVYSSVEAGMLYAAKNGWNSAGITAAPAPVQFCGCPSASGIVATVCTSTCTSGSSPGVYVSVSAALQHDTIIPGLTLPTTLTARSTIRLN